MLTDRLTSDADETISSLEPGVVEEVAEDLFRLVVSVPFSGLKTVNSYLLKDGDGLTLVDTGVNTPAAQAVWRDAFDTLERDMSDVRKVVVTHAHPDHVGLAGWLQRQAEAAPVLLSEDEIAVIRWFDDDQRDTKMLRFLRRCGLPAPPDGSTFTEQGEAQMYDAVRPLPDFTPLHLEESLAIDGRNWRTLRTEGHADGHAALYDPDRSLLLAGDHVLPRTTPNVSSWPHVNRDPLGRYLASLNALRSLNVERAFPGHGPPITNWTRRLRNLQAHHDERLRETIAAVGDGATVAAVSRQLFDLPALHPDQARFALAETLAHLECLEGRGQLRRRTDKDGVWRFERVKREANSTSKSDSY